MAQPGLILPGATQPTITLPQLFLPGAQAGGYSNKVLNTRPNNITAYWPLDERAGTLARDYSGHAYNGAYTGLALGQPGIGDGATSGLYDGATSYANIYSAPLAGAFNGAEGTVMIWAKVANAGVWVDNSERDLVYLSADSNNRIAIRKNTNNNMFAYYTAGGTGKSIEVVYTGVDGLPWFITWSKSDDQVKVYQGAAQVGATQTGLGIWAGALSAFTFIGRNNSGAYWFGYLAHCALWNVPLTAAEISNLARVN